MRFARAVAAFLVCPGTVGFLVAPWDPPRSLVVVGLYRWSRNPMYIAVSLILVGWAVAYSSQPLLIYALAVMAMFYLRVVFGEEPWLARMHGEQWREYRARVRRWLSAAGTANCLKPQAASADWTPHAQR